MRIDRVKLIAELARQNTTAKKLAEICGVSRQTICYIRQGKSCSDEVGRKIADGLGVPLDKLLEK